MRRYIFLLIGSLTINALFLLAIVGSPRGPQMVPRAWGIGGGSFVSRADVSVAGGATVLGVANAARIALVCTNNDSLIAVRVGDANVTATRGVRLAPGGIISVSATSAISAISEGAAVAVSCSEEQL